MQLRSWRFAFSLVVVALLGALIARPAAAQDDESEAFDFDQLEGVQEVVSRTYTIDYSAMMEMTPGAEPDPTVMAQLENPQGLMYILALVGKFDDDGHAEDGYNKLIEEFQAQAGDFTEGTELQEVDLGDLGDNRTGFTATEEEAGVQTNVAIALVQEGEYVYVAITSNAGGDAVEPAKAFVEKLIDNDEGGEDVETDEEGFRSGGLWDKFPDADDEVLQGLVPISDEQLYPVEETPES